MGRISTIEAPVVPTKLADKVPAASIAVLVPGVPTKFPLIRMPPATTNSANAIRMNGTYSRSTVCKSAAMVGGNPKTNAAGTSSASAQKKATLPK